MATHLMKMMETYLMKLCLIEYVLMNLLNDVSTVSTEGNEERKSACAKSMVKEYVSRHTRICLREVAYARGKERAKSRMG